jgi:20S proteasome alpha/beta subunit
MTLCIAAACEDGRGRQRVVIGTDWRISGGIAAGADIQDKLYWINDDIAVLISGEVTRAVELRDTYRKLLRSMASKEPPEVLNHYNVRSFIGAGCRMYKRKLADEVVTFATGLTYEEFRKAVAKKEIPQAVAIPVYQKVEKQDFECEVLIVAFIEGDQFIFQIERSGHVEECENFGIVGEGTYMAEAFLYLRGHSSDCSVGLALFDVWEAMKMSATVVDSVSGECTIDILYPPGERGTHVEAEFLTPAGHKFMLDTWKERFGIRRVKSFPRLPKGSLEPEEDRDSSTAEHPMSPMPSKSPKSEG